MCSQEGLLDLENEKYVPSPGQGSAPPPLHLGVSVHRVRLQLFSLGPIYLLPQFEEISSCHINNFQVKSWNLP